MKVVSIIPARKGSKGIKNKNLIDLCGKPLINYSLEASLKSLVEETWVSSDSEEILEISKNLGAKTIKRPKELCNDDSSSESALIHFAKNVDFDILVFIQCTVPLIQSKDINEGIKKMKLYDSVVSVAETTQMFWDSNGPLYNIDNRLKRYLETGSFFITTKKNLMKSNNRLSGKIGFVEIPKHRSFDIDDYEDLKILKAVINSKEFDSE